MKMKVLLSVIVFTLYTVSYAQNMKMIDTSMPKKDKKDAVVIEIGRASCRERVSSPV